MNAYGSNLPQQAIAAAKNDTAMVDLVVIGDSNVLFGSDGQRGLQGGLCNAITNHSDLNHYGSGVVGPGMNNGSGSVPGNDAANGVDGWRMSLSSGTTDHVDMTTAPAGAKALLDGDQYTNMMVAPIWLETATTDDLGDSYNGSIQITGDHLDDALTFTARYWAFNDTPTVGESVFGLDMRLGQSPWTKFANSTTIATTSGGGDSMERVTLDAPAAARGYDKIQCNFTDMGSQGWDAPLYMGPLRFYYTNGVSGAISVTPLEWFGGGSMYDIMDDLVSTEAKRTGLSTIMDDVAYPAQQIGKAHHIVFTVTSLVNDRSDAALSIDGVNANNTADGFIANLLELREHLFATVPSGSIPSMVIVTTPPTEYENDTTVMAPIRTAVAEYFKARPELDVMAINFDEITDAATMDSASYYSVGGSAHLSETGYDWEGTQIISAMESGTIVADTDPNDAWGVKSSRENIPKFIPEHLRDSCILTDRGWEQRLAGSRRDSGQMEVIIAGNFGSLGGNNSSPRVFNGVNDTSRTLYGIASTAIEPYIIEVQDPDKVLGNDSVSVGSVTGLPTGLSLDKASINSPMEIFRISGTPSGSGSGNIEIIFVDTTGGSVSATIAYDIS